MTLQIDNREDGKRVKAVEKKNDDVELGNLPVGDYVDPEVSLCVEVKSPADLLASLTGGKVHRQLSEAAANYDYPILAIIGNVVEHVDSLKESVPKFRYMKFPRWLGVRGSMLERYYHAVSKIAEERKVGLVQVGSESEFAHWLALERKRLRKRLAGELGSSDRPILTRKGSDRSLREEAEDAICSIGGVGRKTAKALLEAKGSLYNVALSTEGELRQVAGVGPKLAKHLHDVFCEDWSEAP